MKIEIGESIVCSWLRHIQKCQIVQSNWKVSPEWPHNSDSKLQSIMSKANIEFHNPFKKTQNVSQLFRQAEIDALGVNLKEKSIYAVDIAFHEGGLSYGDKFETSNRITKKIIRTVLVLQQYFNDIQNHKIVFVSPKINPEPLSILKADIERVSRFISGESIACEINLIANEDFQNEIFDPISHLSNNIADTSELFLRSIQLAKLFSGRKKQENIQIHQSETRLKLKENKYQSSNKEYSIEIEKISRKVPRWFSHPRQNNSTILINFLELAEQYNEVSLQMLKNKCHAISDFMGNYSQMKNFGEKNHGKVFEETNGYIRLWSPVREIVLSAYNKYKNV